MKVLLVAPHLEHRARGNLTTAHRWAAGLSGLGLEIVQVTAAELDDVDPAGIDLVHAHHARHAGTAAVAFARAQGLPLVVSVGGTDLDGVDGSGPDEESLAAFRAADGLLGPFAETESRLRAALGDATPRYFRVRRGVTLPARPAPLRIGTPLRFLLAGALRPVKGQDLALDWIDHLVQADLSVELVLAGPALEPDWSRAIAERARGRDEIRWIGEVPPERMGHLIAEVDVVLNCSRHEGASNMILEGLAAGRPLVVRRAPGNTELVRGAPREAVRLIDADAPDELLAFARDLIADDRDRRRRRRDRAREWIRHHHRARFELEELHVAYTTTLHACRTRDVIKSLEEEAAARAEGV